MKPRTESAEPQTDPESRRSSSRPPALESERGMTAHVQRLMPLLGDDSLRVRSVLRREFGAARRAGRTALGKATRSSDARTRAHARALLLELERTDVVRRLVRHVSRHHIDFERALMLLGRLERPSLDARPYRRALDAMGAEVARRTERLTNPIDKGRVLVEYLGGELGFGGDPSDYHHPDNAYLHRVIERRRGLPLTLVALYLFVARRAKLRVGVLPLPGHVMLRLYGREQNLIVDPFQGGEVRSQATLMSYLAQNQLSFRSSWFRDAEDAHLFARQVNNLVNALAQHGQKSEAAALGVLQRVLDRRV